MFLGLNTHGEVTGGEIQLRSRATESYVTFSLVNYWLSTQTECGIDPRLSVQLTLFKKAPV